MGLLVNGNWQDKWYDTESTNGKFQREDAIFRNWVKQDGSTPFQPETNRYHLYVSLACPWAHRTLIMRELKSLQAHIDVSIVHPHMLENGWEFQSDFVGSNGDQLYQLNYLHQLYCKAKTDYTGRVTVPVLWDKQKQTIVSNESSEIIRMFNSEFSEFTDNSVDFYPADLQNEINELNTEIYNNINNGVYKCGFATTQEAYNEAIEPLFNCLDKLEDRLSRQKGDFLFEEKITESDIRLFTTLIRFDPVYHGHFKCNLRRIIDYKQLSQYIKNLYHYKSINKTVNFEQIKAHYYYSHVTINPHRVIPKGPIIDYL